MWWWRNSGSRSFFQFKLPHRFGGNDSSRRATMIENAVSSIEALGRHNVFVEQFLAQVAVAAILELHMPLGRKFTKFSIAGHRNYRWLKTKSTIPSFMRTGDRWQGTQASARQPDRIVVCRELAKNCRRSRRLGSIFFIESSFSMSNTNSTPVCLITGGSSGIGLATAKRIRRGGLSYSRFAVVGRLRWKPPKIKLPQRDRPTRFVALPVNCRFE